MSSLEEDMAALKAGIAKYGRLFDDATAPEDRRSLLDAITAKENRLTELIKSSGDVSRGDDFTVSDISKAVYELDAVKFAKASFDQLPYEAVALPVGAASAIYVRLFAPWRHEKWPYSDAQAKWRERIGIKLSPPYYPTKRFLLLIAAAWGLDKFRKVFKQKKSD